jgi:hypothetical protein
MDKYFVIGFNKTATTTFHDLFTVNNLKSQHATKWEVDKYTCFSDNGNFNNFKKLDTDYPNSIFILNIRRLDEWLISRFKHGESDRIKPNWAYPCSEQLCIAWIYERENYYRVILEYFKNKTNKLIIVCIDKENWLDYISTELGFKIKNVKPKNVHVTNKNNKNHINIINTVNSVLNKLKYDNYSRENILFTDINLTDTYLKIYKNNILE